MTSKNTICLWYEGGAVDAANFYAETFPDSAVGAVHRAPGDYPDGKQGDVLTVEFTVVGNGGQESACGWCKDRWGLSWQITPRALIAAISDPDRAAAKRAFDAMMTMKKIDIAAIEAARLGRNLSSS
ncbi:VOC family protein [Noviherbaspirillum saxi]|uniref:VOC family protein n=1 Tax=Noviherbaspirillum saxi TaxID=2320863 RepID=A0A3A3FIK8_9BURK|nr:VOC family protein [Noviherbaspirillum saxi]RJF95328.1 VOC family protein [Noviherbaspirillum saxi]